MSSLRRSLSRIALGWLCCQLSLLTAAPLSLVFRMPHAADSVACTCPNTGSAECPMHQPKPKKDRCACRSNTDPDAGAVLSLLGPIAVLTDAPVRAPNPPITQLPNPPITKFIDAASPPSPPPPRV